MELKKKLTDFITLEDGSIARKSMMLSGAVLAASVLGEGIVATVQAACACPDSGCGCHCHETYTHCKYSHSWEPE